MKAKAYLAGTRAERDIDIPMPNGERVKAVLRALSDAEESETIAAATRDARAAGIEGAGHGEPFFDRAMRFHTLRIAVLDADSPKDAREPFFASVDEVGQLHPEATLYAFHRWEILQAEVSPLKRTESFEDLAHACVELAKDGDDYPFFCGLSPSTRASLARFTASHALNSPELKSFFSSPSALPV